MKHFYFLFLGVFFSFTVHAQIDSVQVTIHESEDGGWEFQTLYADSFSNELLIYHLVKDWGNNSWINTALDTYSYDTSGNVIQKITSLWSNQWINSRNWIYTYDQNNNLLTVTMQTWNANTWKDSTLETHYYDGSTDTLITTMIWNNVAWTDYKKNSRVFDSYLFLTESAFSLWNTTQLVWDNTIKYIYGHDSTGINTSIINQGWLGNQWQNNGKDVYGYDSLGGITGHYDYWWEDTGWWLADQTIYHYNGLHQLTGYDWDCFHGACGFAYGSYQYDLQGNLTNFYHYSESMGGIPSEYRRYYYYLGNSSYPLYVIMRTDFEKCSLDTIPIGAFTVGGWPPLQYQWSPNQGLSSDTVENPLVFANATTIYTLIVTDSTGNADTAIIAVTVNQNPIASISIENIDTTSICNSAMLVTDSLERIWCDWYFNGIIQLNTYGWSAAHFPIDENGFYKVEVRNLDNCRSSDSLEISLLTNPAPAVTITNQCNTLIAQSSGIQSYQWLKNNVPVPGAIYDTLTVTVNDYYSVTVVDSNGCSNTSNRIFFRPMTVAYYLNQSCLDTCNGSIITNVFYATQPVQYVWSNGDTTNNISGLCGGIYSVTITDALGCTSTKTDSVKYRPQHNIQVTTGTVPDSTSCTGVAIAIVDGSINPYSYAYEWTNGSAVFNASNLCAGWNTVTIHDIYYECTQVDSFFIDIVPNNDSCEFNLNSWNPICPGYCDGYIEFGNRLGAAPFFTLWINPNNGFFAQTINNLCPGNYSAVMIDADGCVDTADAIVTEPDSIVGEFSILFASPQQPCSTLVSLDLINDNPPSAIYWQCNGAIGEQTYLCPGICIVTVEDQLGCTAHLTIDVPDSIIACSVIPNSVNVSCFGLCDGSSTAIANGVPPFNYQWSTGTTASTISGLCAGSYTVTMTDSIGCVDSASILITEPSALSSSIFSNYASCQCTFNSLVTGGSFPYTYLWCNNSTAPNLSDCTPGLCVLNITDANGCIIQDTVLINPPPPLTLSPSVSDATCSGCSDGEIIANLTGGVPPYSYSLYPFGNNNNGIFSGLTAGSYILCATDSNVCAVCTTLIVDEPIPSCSVSIIGLNDILCSGYCTGSMQAVGNGIAPYSFVWSNGDSTALADSLCAGPYTVIMIDSTGCSDTVIAVILEPPPIIPSYTSDFSNCNCVYTEIPTGGTPPYTYNWCNGSIDPSLSTCIPGLCIVMILDANGCFTADTVLMIPPAPLSLNVQTTGTSCSGCTDGTVISATAGGFPPYTYLLNPVNLICDTCLNLSAGVYTLCVTDSSNCTVCVTDTVEDDPTSLASLDFTEAVRVFPNPFKNYLMIDITEELLSLHPVFEMQDVTGRIIINVSLKERNFKLFLEALSPGIYFYQLMMDDKKEFKGKLVAAD